MKMSYEKIIETSIKKEMTLLGDPVALRQARKVEGLEVNDDGEITNLEGDGLELFEELVSSYEDVSGPVVDALIAKELNDVFGENLEGTELPERIEKNL